jgi:hypothetical protein
MKQITLVADDRVGLLADVSYILGTARVNIDAISVEVHGGKAIVNLTVKDDQKASTMLSSNGYKILESEVLLVKVKDEPGALSEVTSRLKEGGVSIANLYLLTRGGGYAIDAFVVDKPKKARKLLSEYLVKGE